MKFRWILGCFDGSREYEMLLNGSGKRRVLIKSSYI